jgi:alkanesulfonate monooxygenase SsuD/methylene tetrahydromethanopterin reductase-like flavin-dependent oxidoreductase (luciferase family)
MKIGVQLPEVERPVAWAEMREITLAVEGCGFDSVWMGDHLLYRHDDGVSRGPFEAWTGLAAIAEMTERVEIGPLVASTSFHSPAMLAKKAATVDEISGGRLILGLGAGWNEVEYRAFGFPYDRRVDRFEEAFTIIRTLIRDGSIDFEGRFYRVEESELVPRARRDMKLLVGSRGPRMLAITVPHVDMWNTWYVDYDNDPERIGPLLEALDDICRDVGREPRSLERTAAVYVQLPRGSGRSPGSAKRSPTPPIPSAEFREKIGLFEAAGIGHLQVVLDPIDAPGVEELGKALDRV